MFMVVYCRGQFGVVLDAVHNFGTTGGASADDSCSHLLARSQLTLEDEPARVMTLHSPGVATALVARLLLV